MIISVNLFISCGFIYLCNSQGFGVYTFAQFDAPNILLALFPAHPLKHIAYHMKHITVHGFVKFSQPFENARRIFWLLLNKEWSYNDEGRFEDKSAPKGLSGQRVPVDLVKVKQTSRVLGDGPPVFAQGHEICWKPQRLSLLGGVKVF